MGSLRSAGVGRRERRCGSKSFDSGGNGSAGWGCARLAVHLSWHSESVVTIAPGFPTERGVGLFAGDRKALTRGFDSTGTTAATNLSMRLMIVALATILGPSLASACACDAATSACREVAGHSLVFVGTVESIKPRFLDHWNSARRPSLTEIIDSDNRFLADGSRQNFEALKKEFREKLSDLPPAMLSALAAAQTHDQVLRIFEDMLRRGRVVRLHVDTLFNRGRDDDDDKAADTNDNDDDLPRSLDVATPFGDCGYNFQRGETYLVYALHDEDTPIPETDSCTATKRLSDAGTDLPYLYLLKKNRAAAGHLEGVTTYDPHRALNPLQEPDVPSLPAAGLIVGVASGDQQRYAISDSLGKFVFDGLPPGDYNISAWAPGYPDSIKLLAGPTRFHVEPQSCLNQVLLIPRP